MFDEARYYDVFELPPADKALTQIADMRGDNWVSWMESDKWNKVKSATPDTGYLIWDKARQDEDNRIKARFAQ